MQSVLPSELGFGPFMLPQHSLGASSALPPVDCYLRSLFMTGVVSGISWFPRFVTHDYSRPSNYYSGPRHGLKTTT